jgi:hypothetical protein
LFGNIFRESEMALFHDLLDIVEYVMIASTSHPAWLFYAPLAQQAALLKDDLLDPVDQLLYFHATWCAAGA